MVDDRPVTRLERLLDRVLVSMERMNFEEYLRYVGNARRQFAVNFAAGLARGLGAAVGFSLLGAIAIAVLQRLIINDSTGIGRFLADVIQMALDRL